MIDDLDERPWFVFQLPAATTYVPAPTEEQARRQLVKSSYDNAPVHAWPCVGSRFTSREALVKALLRPRPMAHQGDARKDGNG